MKFSCQCPQIKFHWNATLPSPSLLSLAYGSLLNPAPQQEPVNGVLVLGNRKISQEVYGHDGGNQFSDPPLLCVLFPKTDHLRKHPGGDLWCRG